ncbi:hypothetical protein RhiJN_28525 [Ceratobasidium sp. AG-Ba]|nr:hypothetical protein RhiJN_28525 [Ceratobasidium sp. AG-Ba]
MAAGSRGSYALVHPDQATVLETALSNMLQQRPDAVSLLPIGILPAALVWRKRYW